ncbi:uncharacterized protein LODBEIA_P32840 [Lodderomyces beijingensis]|uniref:Zn(2)-C6 fungal-type domain-containing protein n=1 Tax=Lodderomyces beijingensis TaxID=1775926 RepID=A0ABP0ZS72_9ASCO
MEGEKKKKIKRSRKGCHACKRLKIKCDEQKPKCSYCTKRNFDCDYSMKLTWGGRPYKDASKRSSSKNSYPSAPQTPKDKEYLKENLNRTLSKEMHIVPENESLASVFAPPPPPLLLPHEHEIHTPITPLSSFLIPAGTATSLLEGGNRGNDSSVLPISDNPPLPLPMSSTQTGIPLEEHGLVPAGLDELERTITRRTGGEFQFIPRNSAILSDFMERFDGQNNWTHADVLSSLSSYTQDLSAIEQYMPSQAGHLVPDVMPLVYRPRAPLRAEQEPVQPPLLGVDAEKERPEYFFSQIPRQLTPLPSLLLEVPFYRDLMHFWVNVASQHLVPAPSGIYKENPFRILLPQMAMEYSSVLTILLAFSAKIRASLIGTNDVPDEIIEKLMSRSCSELLHLLQDNTKATSDQTLATALLLSCFEIFDSKDFSKHRAHTIGARQIIKARSMVSMERTNLSGSDKDVTFFLLRWFVYMDVIGALSASKNSDKYLLITDDLGSYEPVSSVVSLNYDKQVSENSSSLDVDRMMGFDLQLLSYFAKITLVTRKISDYLKQEGAHSVSIPLELISEVLEIKKALQDQCSREEDSMTERQKKIVEVGDESRAKEIEILKCTNRIFCDAGTIHLYRRALHIPRRSPLVQNLASNIGLLTVKMIPAKSPTETCCIFCFFTAACETLDVRLQEFFKTKFQEMSDMGNINAKKSLQIMKHCWSSGDDWLQAAEKLNLDFALF